MPEKYTFLESKSFLLSPTSNQKKRLDYLFDGLICVFDLITDQKHILKNKFDIKKFLLINKNKIDCHIHMLDKEIAYGILVEVVFQWLNADKFPQYPIIDFDEKCSVSNENKIFLPISKIGLIDINQDQFNTFVESVRGQHKKYDPYFSIFKKGSNFFIEIDLLEKNKKIDHLKQKAPNKKHKKPQKHNVKSSEVLSLFDRVCMEFARRAREQAFMDRQYRTSNFDDLSGRPVSGGLPSLGKRR